MPKFTVIITREVSTYADFEAETPEKAIDLAIAADDEVFDTLSHETSYEARTPDSALKPASPGEKPPTERFPVSSFKGHPDIEVPQWALDFGFKDESWRNESCGKLTHDEKRLALWVDRDDPLDRDGEQEHKYCLARYDPKEGLCGAVLLETNDAESVIRAIHSAV